MLSGVPEFLEKRKSEGGGWREWTEGWRRWGLKWDTSKDPRDLEGRPTVGRGGTEAMGGEVFEEPVWGDLKFPKETNKVPKYPL